MAYTKATLRSFIVLAPLDYVFDFNRLLIGPVRQLSGHRITATATSPTLLAAMPHDHWCDRWWGHYHTIQFDIDLETNAHSYLHQLTSLRVSDTMPVHAEHTAHEVRALATGRMVLAVAG
jgi:hypothetical protein